MAVPKRKTSKSKRDMRSAGKGLKKKNISIVNGEFKISHYNYFYNKRIRKPKETEEQAA